MTSYEGGRTRRRLKVTITHNDFPATRRVILQGAVTVALTGIGNLSLGFAPALAAANDKSPQDKYPEDAFTAKNEAEAIKLLYGKTAEPSDQVKLDAPEIAENGAVVPISVSTSLTDVTSISILVPENPNVLAASYKIPAGTMASVANRLKMAKTSNVIAIVEAGGKLYSATKEVKVTVGGCGG
ncbi:MAG: sulfur-oxidizing protein SoxY [Bradyrhizobium sp.]|jgi:sulfur-oxidizing protein SoxY|nr:sulfur-oxidizing protein SoxY [Bradyrhizobium sp.]